MHGLDRNAPWGGLEAKMSNDVDFFSHEFTML